MPMFITEHRLSGLTQTAVQSLSEALDVAGSRLTEAGEALRLVSCTCTDERFLVCEFAATSAALVGRALSICQLPLPVRCTRVDGRD